MPRRPRLAAGDLAYHVLNRRVGRLLLFDKPGEQKGDRLLITGTYGRKTEKISETDAIRACHSGEPIAREEWHALAIVHSLRTIPYCS
jgi:hypothetical protein